MTTNPTATDATHTGTDWQIEYDADPIEFTGDGVALTLDLPDTSEPAAGFETTGVSAD